MRDPLTLTIVIVAIIVFIGLIRFLGAWMLRIDEVIKNQKSIIDELKKINKKGLN